MGEKLHHNTHTGTRGNAPGSVPGLVRAREDAVPSRLNIIAYGPEKLKREHNVTIERVAEIRAQQKASASPGEQSATDGQSARAGKPVV